MKDVIIYDNGGKTIDRITIVLLKTKRRPLFGRRSYDYNCIGSCLTGNSFFQHSNCQRGKHLGKIIKFDDLSKELKQTLKNY